MAAWQHGSVAACCAAEQRFETQVGPMSRCAVTSPEHHDAQAAVGVTRHAGDVTGPGQRLQRVVATLLIRDVTGRLSSNAAGVMDHLPEVMHRCLRHIDSLPEKGGIFSSATRSRISRHPLLRPASS